MRSALAVIAGYVTAVILVVVFFGIHAAIFGARTAPGTAGSLVGLAWGVVTAIAGGWVTARLAPSDPMRHAVWLITLSLTIGILFTWVIPLAPEDARSLEPMWVQIGNLVVVVIGVPIGARLIIRTREQCGST
jgi:hypothetical protein